MRYVRVKDKETGHEFSVPETDPLLKGDLVRVVSRKPATSVMLPPKHHKTLPRRGETTKEA